MPKKKKVTEALLRLAPPPLLMDGRTNLHLKSSAFRLAELKKTDGTSRGSGMKRRDGNPEMDTRGGGGGFLSDSPARQTGHCVGKMLPW